MLFPGLMTILSVCASHFHMNHPLAIQFTLNFFRLLTHMGGSEIQTAAYSIGYPLIIVMASIHLLSLQSLLHLMFGRFLLILRTLPLEPLGPKFSTVHSASRFFLVTFVLIWCMRRSLAPVPSSLPSSFCHKWASHRISFVYELTEMCFLTYISLLNHYKLQPCWAG